MAKPAAQQVVRDYLTALKDPSALRDDAQIEALEKKLDEAEDPLERVHVRQQLIDAKTPDIERYEQGFVEHARQWAEETGVTAAAFETEGVPAAVLRRAGFTVRGGRSGGRGERGRGRVNAERVRAAIPRGTFTIKRLEELSGASSAVVRRVVQSEIEAGNLREAGPDPDHRGPGRSPALYRR